MNKQKYENRLMWITLNQLWIVAYCITAHFSVWFLYQIIGYVYRYVSNYLKVCSDWNWSEFLPHIREFHQGTICVSYLFTTNSHSTVCTPVTSKLASNRCTSHVCVSVSVWQVNLNYPRIAVLLLFPLFSPCVFVYDANTKTPWTSPKFFYSHEHVSFLSLLCLRWICAHSKMALLFCLNTL